MCAGDAEHAGLRQQGQEHHEQARGEPEAHKEDADQGETGAAHKRVPIRRHAALSIGPYDALW